MKILSFTGTQNKGHLDTDIVVLAPLDGVWQPRKDLIFQWGTSGCSGLLILNLLRMEEFWTLATSSIMDMGSHDQAVLRAVARDYPSIAQATVDDAWDVHLANGGVLYRRTLLKKYPAGIGMLHFNGGGSAEGAWFDKNGSYRIARRAQAFLSEPGWRLARYYIELPWAWVSNIGANACQNSTCSRIRLEYASHEHAMSHE